MEETSYQRLTKMAEEVIKNRAMHGLHHEAYGAYLLWRELIPASIKERMQDGTRIYQLCQLNKISERSKMELEPDGMDSQGIEAPFSLDSAATP